jgi:hypothetical protein
MEERILEYGSIPLNQRRLYRRLIRGVLLLGLVAAAAILGRSALKWGQFIYWQQQCLNFTFAPNQIVYASQSEGMPPVACTPALRFGQVSGTQNSGMDVFVHRMRRPDGTQCLVELDFVWTSIPGDTDAMTTIGALKSSVWVVSPIANLATQDMFTLPDATLNAPWRIYAGQVDPNNPSHLTFVYEYNGQKQTFDAWLNNSNQLIISPPQPAH